MALLILKLTLTPLLIAVATLAARRWGPAVGGWVAGLPLTSGPVSVFLALEQGPHFAARAAGGTLLGLGAVAAFCLTYARSANGSTWRRPAAAGLGAYGIVTWGVSLPSLPLLGATVAALLFLGMALGAFPHPRARTVDTPAPWWDLPVRMATATGMVLFITAAARVLGPKWSGLLSPFPVFACVMAIFTHRHAGAEGARRLLRGVLVGSFAFASFFVAVGLLLTRLPVAVVYIVATGVALTVNAISLVGLLRPGAAG
ncbi:MAG TPA: hypothetical protein VF454_01670 [Gemmatimonadales bacterium]